VVARAGAPALDQLWRAVEGVQDPEVPVLSVVDLGVIRDIRVDAAGEVDVDITPTYSGCPAMHEIESGVATALREAGATAVRVHRVFSPAWTTDWIRPDARERLRAYGIAPPGPATDEESVLTPLLRRAPAVTCPFCGSRRTEERSHFGSTACKSIHFCSDCHQPFEHFKAI